MLQIESVYAGTARVRLVDLGTSQTVTVKEIYPLKQQFAEHPPFALHCTLDGAKPKVGGKKL